APRIKPCHAAVIGAGLAGSACAAQLKLRGFEVEVIERRGAAASEASGNPGGLLMPSFSLDWNLPTRLTTAAFLHTLRGLQAAPGPGWFASGVLQLARDDARLERLARIIDRYRLPEELVRIVTGEEAAERAGRGVAAAGWWLPSAGWADSAQLCRQRLA